MIPLSFIPEYNPAVLPTETWGLAADGLSLAGRTDRLDAMRQAVYLILNIERYQYPIYSWNYGVELWDLFGQPVSFVKPELERRVREALVQDDRIAGVDSFSFAEPQPGEKGTLCCSFTVHSVYGDFDMEKTVKIAYV